LRRNFKCQFEGCEKKFFKQVYYDAHVKIHKGEEVSVSVVQTIFEIAYYYFYFQPFTCKICYRPLKSGRTLKRHMLIHESKEKRMHKCNECYRTYGNKASFLDHLKSHSGQQHICEQCGRSFQTRAKLRVSKQFDQLFVF
jgi:Zn-finger protein